MSGFRYGRFAGGRAPSGRDTRALHGATATRPIEIAVSSPSARAIEIVVGGAVVRVEAGVDVGYVASLVRAISER